MLPFYMCSYLVFIANITFLVPQAVQLPFLHQRLGLLHKGDHPSEGRRQNLFDELLEGEEETKVTW